MLRSVDHTESHKHTHTSASLLWTSDQPVAKAAPTQHTTNTRDENPCPQWDSNLRSQQSSCRRPHGQQNWMLFVTHIMSDLQLLKNLGLQALDCCDRRFESRLWHGCFFCCFGLCCVGSGLCDGLITRPEESYRLCVCVYVFVCI